MTRLHLTPFALRVLLKRRDRRLILEERAAVQAALDGATPEERSELERRLSPAHHQAASVTPRCWR